MSPLKSSFIFTFLYLILNPPILMAFQSGEENGAIEWHAKRKLVWDDFKGKTPSNSQNHAQSWVGIDFFGKCVANKFVFEVTAVFNMDSSWVVEYKNTERLLKHEQGHFDIAEIFARKLRKRLGEIKQPCSNMDNTELLIQKLTKNNKIRLLSEQDDYDRETRHGSRKNRQKKWQEKISNRLKSLEKYK